MNCVIVYYSHTGNNERIALELRKRLRCEVYKINEKKKRKTLSILFDFLFNRTAKLDLDPVSLQSYKHIVFVGPIWGGKVSSPIRTFMKNEKKNIQKYSFVSICNGEVGQREKLIKQMETLAQKPPTQVLELSINRLLPEEMQYRIKHTFNYRLKALEIEQFDKELKTFVNNIIT